MQSQSRGERLFAARARLCEGGDESALSSRDEENAPSQQVERVATRQNGAELFLKRSAALGGDCNLTAELNPDEWKRHHDEAEKWKVLKATRHEQAREAATRAREARARAAAATSEAEAEAANAEAVAAEAEAEAAAMGEAEAADAEAMATAAEAAASSSPIASPGAKGAAEDASVREEGEEAEASARAVSDGESEPPSPRPPSPKTPGWLRQAGAVEGCRGSWWRRRRRRSS